MKFVYGLFLIAHGLIHYSFISPQPEQKPGAPAWPFDITKSWLLGAGLSPEALKAIGITLTLVSTIGFIASGLGWLGVPILKGLWVPITVVSSVASFLLVAVFWNNWFVMAPIINAVILYLIFAKDVKPL